MTIKPPLRGPFTFCPSFGTDAESDRQVRQIVGILSFRPHSSLAFASHRPLICTQLGLSCFKFGDVASLWDVGLANHGGKCAPCSCALNFVVWASATAAEIWLSCIVLAGRIRSRLFSLESPSQFAPALWYEVLLPARHRRLLT